jgi:outer membrane protein TolC
MFHLSKYLLTFIAFIHISMFSDGQDNSLTLSAAIEKALENNYGILISRSQSDIAELNNNWGTAGRYPTIGFNATSSNNLEVTDNVLTNRLSGDIGMNWIIFDGYRVNITKDKLGKLEELSKGQSAVVVENTIQNVVLGYYNVLLQKEQLQVLTRVMKLSSDRFKYEKMRRELGSSLTYNVLQAKNVYFEDSAAVLNQEVVLRNAIRNLNFVLGEEASARWTFADSFEPDTSRYTLGNLHEKMLSNNQTLQNQYTNLMIRKDEIKLTESNLYPSLRFSAGLNNTWSRTQNEGMDPMTRETVLPYANISLGYDIYTGSTRKRAIEVAKVNEEIVQTEIEEMKHSLTNLLFNEYDLYNVRRTLLDVAMENLDAAELNLDIAEEKFRNGTINSFNYRDIQLIYLNAAFQRLRSIYNLIDSNTNLTRLVGGFVEEQSMD